MKKFIFLQLIGVGIVFYLFMGVDYQQMMSVIKKIRVEYIFVAIPLSLVFIVIKGLRWLWFLERQEINKKISLVDAIRIYFASFYLSILTPAKLGDFFKIGYLKGRDVPEGVAMATVLVDRLMDVAVLLLVAIFSVFYLPAFRSQNFSYPLIMIVFLLLLLTLWFYGRRRQVTVWMVKLAPHRFRAIVETHLEHFWSAFTCCPAWFFLALLVTGLLCWSVYYFQVWMLTKALELHMNFLSTASLATICSLLSIIPISPTGLNVGPRDAALVVGFSILGFGGREAALALSTLMLLTILVDGFIGFIIFMTTPMRVEPEVQKERIISQ